MNTAIPPSSEIFQANYWVDVLGSMETGSVVAKLMEDVCVHGHSDKIESFWGHLTSVADHYISEVMDLALLHCVDNGNAQSLRGLLDVLSSDQLHLTDRMLLGESSVERNNLDCLRVVMEYSRWSDQRRQQLLNIAAQVFQAGDDLACVDVGMTLAAWGHIEIRRQIMEQMVTGMLDQKRYNIHDPRKLHSASMVIDRLLDTYGTDDFLDLHVHSRYRAADFDSSCLGQKIKAMNTHAALTEQVNGDNVTTATPISRKKI